MVLFRENKRSPLLKTPEKDFHTISSKYSNFFWIFQLTHLNWLNVNWTEYLVQNCTIWSYGFLLFHWFGHFFGHLVFYLLGPLDLVCVTSLATNGYHLGLPAKNQEFLHSKIKKRKKRVDNRCLFVAMCFCFRSPFENYNIYDQPLYKPVWFCCK